MLSAVLGDKVDIQLGDGVVTLRPTLRSGIAALRLHGSFEALIGKILELDTGTVEALIAIGEGASRPYQTRSLREIGDLHDGLVDYAIILANGGVRPTAGPDEAASARESHEAYFARLFKLGTGWLGWTPDATLDAAMPAIVSAYAGRMDLLRAIFGDGKAQERNAVPLDEKVRAVFDHMGTTKVPA